MISVHDITLIIAPADGATLTPSQVHAGAQPAAADGVWGPDVAARRARWAPGCGGAADKEEPPGAARR